MDYDFSALAAGYSSFLTALAGVSITVLTLVVTLYNEEHHNRRLYPHLLAGLCLSAVSSFVGSHLMIETTGSRDDSATLRFFMLAAPNIYLASLLFILCLVIIVNVFSPRQTDTNAKKLIHILYVGLTLGACLYILSFVLAYCNLLGSEMVICMAAFSAAFFFIGLLPIRSGESEQLSFSPFYIAGTMVLCSLVLFATSDLCFYPFHWCLCFYAWGAALPLGAFLQLECIAHRSEEQVTSLSSRDSEPGGPPCFRCPM